MPLLRLACANINKLSSLKPAAAACPPAAAFAANPWGNPRSLKLAGTQRCAGRRKRGHCNTGNIQKPFLSIQMRTLNRNKRGLPNRYTKPSSIFDISCGIIASRQFFFAIFPSHLPASASLADEQEIPKRYVEHPVLVVQFVFSDDEAERAFVLFHEL